MTNIQGDRLPAYTFRNRIINGDFKIDQRNYGATQIVAAAGGPYGADRWQVAPTGNSCAAKQISTGSGFAYVLMGNTSLSNSFISTKLEANNILDLLGTNVTLQAKISSTTLTTLTWGAYYSNNVIDTWSTANSINFANGSWTINSTATVYSTTFTVNNSCSNGMSIYFITNSFTSGNLTITDIQLEAGSVPSPFERLPLGIQYMLCQRYYSKSYTDNITPGSSVGAGAGSVFFDVGVNALSDGCSHVFPVPLRAKPTITSYDNAGTAGSVSYYSSGWNNGGSLGSLSVTSNKGFFFQANSSANWGAVSFDYAVTAEL